MITREQVADLQPGDVVELSGHPMLQGATLRGPLYESSGRGELSVGDYVVRYRDGRPNHTYADRMNVLLVSRAPRPLYVNSDRTEPVPGDVVAAAEPIEIVPGWQPTWVWTSGEKWVGTHTGRPIVGEMCSPLRLLVDGSTGEVVQ